MRGVRNKIFVCLGLVALLLGCDKKPLPEPDSQKPVFYFSAQLNGQSVYLNAGEDNYYMKSSHYLDTNKVYVFQADLRQQNCNSNCNYALRILINDKKISNSNDPIAIQEALQNGSYQYNNIHTSPLFYKVVLKPIRAEKSLEKYRWLLNGKETMGYTVSAVVEGEKIFTPTFSYEDVEGGCSTVHSKQYKVGNPLQSSIEVQKQGMPELLMYSFSSINNGTPPYNYMWQFGDGTSDSYSEHPFHRYTSQGFFTAKLTLIDGNQDTCISFYQVPAFVEPKCEANFNATFTPISNPPAYSAITIQLTHPDGSVFSSEVLPQNEGNNFDILEVVDYQLNEDSEPTKKIKIRFNCTVQNGLEKIKIENAEAVMAVSYK